jgi:hypothetical protein
MALTLDTRPSGYNCVHLPIVYEFSSTAFPTNSVDTSRTVSSFTNDNGYCKLALSGDIKASGSANELEFVKVVYSGGTEIFQIITWYSDTSITIDLEYNASLTFTSVQYYYSNYHARFKIYAGLRSGHTLNAQKPYRLLTTIKAVPDSANDIVINIAEILKSDISVLSIDTDGNDISQFTEFYIEYAEAYDYSVDGYTLTTYVSSYTSDSSNYAIATNSKLPFKNGNGGEMDLYVGTSRKYLTLFDEPVIFPGNDFYLFFMGDPYNLSVTRYADGVSLGTSTITVTDEDEGVYSKLLNSVLQGNEDELSVVMTGQSETKTIKINNTCYNDSIYLGWLNYLGGMDYWLFTAEKDFSIDIEEVKTTEKDIFIDWPTSYNGSKIKYDTKRTARESILVRSQNLTFDQLSAIKYIKTSPLVMWNGKNVSVDGGSFLVYSETDKLYSISFTIQMTDTIPSQSL